TSRSHTFTEPGPHVILCHVHPEMAAYVVVVDTPHHGVTDREGRFRIEEVPTGTYRLGVWQRGFPSVEAEMTVPPGGTESLVLDVSEAGVIEVVGRR
ncbi:MAG TPA: carboxypeptidase regulatory-like domain-containing protein, partial [Longimicrobiales bacterium]|nr:carboxypeptidase regulatory-like domain-containing protein [Longimicrobiales bacterium]